MLQNEIAKLLSSINFNLLETGIFSGIFIYATILFIFKNKLFENKSDLTGILKKIIVYEVFFYVLYALLISAGQYFVWLTNEETIHLLSRPFNEKIPAPIFRLIPYLPESHLGYYIHYVLTRFWLKVFLSILSAFIFGYFLKILKHYKERYFDDGEVEIGIILTLMAGWPGIVFFLPATFLFVIFISIYKVIFLKENLTTLGYPLILAGIICLIFKNQIIDFFNLIPLRI